MTVAQYRESERYALVLYILIRYIRWVRLESQFALGMACRPLELDAHFMLIGLGQTSWAM
jgi:hypothetical protein